MVLRKAGRLQSTMIGIVPVVPTFCVVITFGVHTLLGYPLDAAQVAYPIVHCCYCIFSYLARLIDKIFCLNTEIILKHENQSESRKFLK